MANNIRLNVLFTKDRNHPGWLRVEVDGSPKAEFRVLGRGSTTVDKKPTGNPSLNPFLYAGNTPTGDYVSQGIVSTDDWNQASYGSWGAIRLKAVGGDALLAERFGRTSLLIHGGAAGQFDGYRSTLGCLRLSNLDMKRLTQMLVSAGEDPRAMMCQGIVVTVNVRQF